MNIKNAHIVVSVLIAVLMIIAGYFLLSGGDSHRIWRSILINFLFFTPAAGGMVVWPAIVIASNGKWMGSLERFCWTGLSFSIPSIIVLIILWMGSHQWAPWIDSPKGWLDNTFLFSRNLVLLVIFWIFAFIFLKNRKKRNKVVLAAWLILIYAVVFSVEGFDFVMALEPKWYSMMAGGYFFISGLYIAAAAWAFLTAIMERTPDKDGLQDIGKLVITFCMLTSYLMFSQLLPIWYENLPDETVFLISRMNLAWKGISYLLLIIIYLGPVIFLLHTVHHLNISMASTAVYLIRDMNGMVEINEIGQLLPYFHPRQRMILIIMLMQLLNFRMLHNDPLVAEHARLQRWNICLFCFFGSIMTHHAA